MWSCDKTAENICYATLRNITSSSHHFVGQIDFDSITNANISSYYETNSLLSSLVALSSDEVLVAGHRSSTYQHRYFRYNFASQTHSWQVDTGDALDSK